MQFYAFLQDKIATQRVKGGNTEAFYAKEGTLAKSKMQVAMHPDVSRLVWKFGRWHHHVDYSVFKGLKLKRHADIEVQKGPDNYGLKLQVIDAARP